MKSSERAQWYVTVVVQKADSERPTSADLERCFDGWAMLGRAYAHDDPRDALRDCIHSLDEPREHATSPEPSRLEIATRVLAALSTSVCEPGLFAGAAYSPEDAAREALARADALIVAERETRE